MVLAVVSGTALAVNEPYVISFQGKLEGVTLPVNIIFTLYNDETAGSSVWTETHNNVDVDVDTGIFNELLGNQQDLGNALTSATGGLWMQINVNGADLTPRQPLTAAPYAFVAEKVNADTSGIIVNANSSDKTAVYAKTLSNSWGDPAIYAEGAAVAIEAKSNAYGVVSNVNGSGSNYTAVSGTNTGAGNGVYGEGAAAYGVYGKTLTADQAGVYGEAPGNLFTWQNMGGKFKAAGGNGIGVYGEASNTVLTAPNIGGKFEAAGGEGIGVYGTAKKYGVYGTTASGTPIYGYKPNGINSAVNARPAILGLNEGITFGDNPGVKGKSTRGVGVYGESTDSDAVRAISTNGVGIFAKSTDVAGIVGISGQLPGAYDEDDARNYAAGVRGFSKAGRGVEGISENSRGVEGTSTNNHGVTGSTANNSYAGVYGSNSGGLGVKGYASGDSGKGVYGETTTGIGVLGKSTTGSTNLLEGHGVVGLTLNANVPTTAKRYGGLFTSGAGGRALGVSGHIYATGNVYTAVTLDIAEWVKASDSSIEKGDVVVIDRNKMNSVKKSSAPNSTLVAGIVSSDPAFLAGNHTEKDDIVDKEVMQAKGYRMLALAGQVPTKVSAENGPVAIGDLLTTSNTPGHAMKATNPQIGTIVGKALEALPSGTGKIKVLVTLQ